jgi:hypothetical protein
MDFQLSFKEKYRLTLPEMEWIMDQLGAPPLIGINSEDLQKALSAISDVRNETAIRKSLREKGILLSSSDQEIRWSPEARSCLEAALFPERTMLVVRDQTRDERRFFRLLRKGETTVLHSFPNERGHLIGIFRNPEEILQLVLSWFPLNSLPYASVNFRMEKVSFEKFKSLLVAKKRDEAWKTFNLANGDSAAKRQFLNCLRGATLSGSIAQCRVQEDQTYEGNSIAFLTDGRTGWLITQSDRLEGEPIRLDIRRTGLDFTAAVRDQIEALTGKRLPRSSADPGNRSIRFALTADELAQALAAINCRNLSKKIFAAVSLDAVGSQYEARMDRAQQSLIEAGLCKRTDAGVLVLSDDLACAVLPIGGGDAMVQVVTSTGGPPENVGVYLSRRSLFTAYFNYGEYLQVLSAGRYPDAGAYIQSLFPDFGVDSKTEKSEARFSMEIINKVMHEAEDAPQIRKMLMSEGVSETAALLFSEDAANVRYYSTLTRRNMPRRQSEPADRDPEKSPSLFLLKSPRHSWLVQFPEGGEKGMATIVHREEFTAAIEALLV